MTSHWPNLLSELKVMSTTLGIVHNIESGLYSAITQNIISYIMCTLYTYMYMYNILACTLLMPSTILGNGCLNGNLAESH